MLKDIQGKFVNAVMKGDNEPFLNEIEEGGKIAPSQRLQIYAHAYKSRLLETLAEDFPVLHLMVGDKIFKEICLGYINLYPSTHPSLRYFGQHMVKYLKDTKPYSGLIPAIEMADFEWTFNDVFDAKDVKAVSVEDVAAIPAEAWSTLRIHLQPSFFMKKFKWNTPAVWSSGSNENEECSIDPEEYPVSSNCIQWKTDLKCYFRTVENDEASVLFLAQENKTFPDICEKLIEQYDDQAPMRAAELLRGWVTEGLVSELEYLKV